MVADTVNPCFGSEYIIKRIQVCLGLHLDPVPRGKKINEKNSLNNKKKFVTKMSREIEEQRQNVQFFLLIFTFPLQETVSIFLILCFFYHLLSIFSAKNILKQILMFDSLIKFNFLIL